MKLSEGPAQILRPSHLHISGTVSKRRRDPSLQASPNPEVGRKTRDSRGVILTILLDNWLKAYRIFRIWREEK